MTIRNAALVSAGLVAATAAVGVWAWWRLPAGATIAIHFNFHGDPDGFAPKAVGLALMPLIGALVVALLAALPAIAPRRKALEASADAFGTVMIGVAAIFLVTQCAIVARAMDPRFDVIRWLFVAIGVLFIAVGNVLGKLRHNYFIGIRTPWALANERVWDKTHRFTGRLMLLAGLTLAAGAALIADHRLIIALLIFCAAGPAIAGAIYSWRTYRRLGMS
ncbi:MAG TPA: SdpI family protein [Caulobacteraceae bacterium]